MSMTQARQIRRSIIEMDSGGNAAILSGWNPGDALRLAGAALRGDFPGREGFAGLVQVFATLAVFLTRLDGDFVARVGM